MKSFSFVLGILFVMGLGSTVARSEGEWKQVAASESELATEPAKIQKVILKESGDTRIR